MMDWIKTDWGNFFTNPSTPGSDGKILIADIHCAQQTENVKLFLSKCKTVLTNILGGLTSYLQVLDVIVNKLFKNSVRSQSDQHMLENIDKYVNNKLTASDRRILITKWCGEAWAQVDRESVKYGFKKLGLSTA